MRRTTLAAISAFGLAAVVCLPSIALAQVAPPLGTAQQFGVLGNSGVTGATGTGVVVTGDVGSSPTPTISNFPPSSTATPFIVHGTNDGVVQLARTDAIAAYNALLIQGTGTVLPDNLATVGALVSGIYSFVTGSPDLPASATLTLNGGGIFVFNVGSSLTANVMSTVVGTANPCNVYWRVGSSATLNGTNFMGTVIADASITIGDAANLAGRALAGTGATGAVTMAGSGGNTIGGCSAAPVCPTISFTPTTVPNGTVGAFYSLFFTGSGGIGPYTFTVTSGSLPPVLTLTPAGQLSGVPTVSGPSAFVIRATDSNACFVEQPYTMTVVSAIPTLPHVLAVLFGLGLLLAGYARLRDRARA